SVQRDATNLKTSLMQRYLKRIAIFKKKKGAFDRYVDVLFLREESRRRGSGLASSLLHRLEVAKRRGEKLRYADVTRLVGLVQSQPVLPKIQPFIRDMYRFMSDVVEFVASAPALFFEIQISVHHPFKDPKIAIILHYKISDVQHEPMSPYNGGPTSRS
ncbi:MAG: hypothetical protein PV344_02910, partial [Anaplasma sp.]|nr:hypothetical protein [Anaplasma sp.]